MGACATKEVNETSALPSSFCKLDGRALEIATTIIELLQPFIEESMTFPVEHWKSPYILTTTNQLLTKVITLAHDFVKISSLSDLSGVIIMQIIGLLRAIQDKLTSRRLWDTLPTILNIKVNDLKLRICLA
ncbi:hypothetical protein [Microcoleus sp.]|uniref:hypothetical protein n=1 Tax=Microcoleus sp. TaxID=44472 RepID=UPI0035942A1E